MPQGRELRLHEQRNVPSRLDLRSGVWKWEDETEATEYVWDSLHKVSHVG